MTTARDRDYVLGTHDDEIARLGLQHRVWRPRVLDAWQRAGLVAGQRVLDVGCGPGYAALDLAEIVGSTGRVVAVERSRRFLDVLEGARSARGLDQISTFELDLDESRLPASQLDAAWCRWVLAFVKRPRDLAARVVEALRPGGVFVIHEYVNYGAWSFLPKSESFDEFVALVISSWRGAGGEPNIGLELPRWLEELGLETTARPVVDVVSVSHPIWQWPRAFVQVGLARLVEIGRLSDSRCAEIWCDFLDQEAAPATLMMTPVVLEIIARKR
jgi:SAM-dependent methyltransferase